ncbi:RecQ family ATP-dependent DNA helicase [Vibrio splendidus]
MSQVNKATAALKEYFGYDTFRDGQVEIIDASLSNKDTLGILTTGTGKSVCFQIPTLINGGVNLVVSPLISLMKDQVDELTDLGIKATYINSTLDEDETIRRIIAMANNEYQFVYVAPERLQQSELVDAAATCNLDRLTIDEAHCASLWGHDFRPSYTKIGEFRSRLAELREENVPCIALTATASQRVRNDLVDQLRLNAPLIHVGSFKRHNLDFHVNIGNDKSRQIADILDHHRGEATIIYCATVKQVNTLSKLLEARQHSSVMYHGQLPAKVKNDVQDAFMSGRVNTVIATNAFGMGVNKSNVRAVIHYSMPKNLENYFQEAGRAGRDGERSSAYLLYEDGDRNIQDFFNHSAYPSKQIVDEVKRTYLLALDDGVNKIRFDDIAQRMTIPAVKTFEVQSALNLLVSSGVFERHDLGEQSDYAELSVIDSSCDPDFDVINQRKKIALDGLNLMHRYCISKMCRHDYILKHFGESSPEQNHNCGACDVCLGSQSNLTQSDEYLANMRVILSLVNEAGGKVPPRLLADVLCGTSSKLIERKHYDKFKDYGALAQHTKPEIKSLMTKMLDLKWMMVTQTGGLKLLKAGRSECDLNLVESSSLDVNGGSVPENDSALPFYPVFERPLFERLAGLRTLIAQRERMPLQSMMSDNVLEAFAASKPQSHNDLTLCGLGIVHAKTFGDDIIAEVVSYLEDQQLKSKPLSASKRPTL